jgi:hypothetical protein
MSPVDLTAQTSYQRAGARIDWAQRRIVGYSVSEGDAYDVVSLLLNNKPVASAIANRSAFEFARDLGDLGLPPREQSAFELRIPQGSLIPEHLGGVTLEVRSARGESVFSHEIKATHELLHLTEGVPADLLFDVQFRGFRSGAVHGVVRDRHEAGVRPALQYRFNDSPAEPLVLFDSTPDGNLHHFAVPLRADALAEGENVLHILAADGLPLASYPLRLGVGMALDTDQRVAALEAELAFLKHLVLSSNGEAIGTRLALLKSEIVVICSDMLALQRVNLEREARAAQAMRSGAAG